MLDRPDTVIPTEQDAALAARASRLLAKNAGRGLRVQIETGEELRLPSAAEQLLAYVLTEMSQGNAVTLIPLHAELTTQQAAELLNVSRPHVVHLLETGLLPFRKVGTHRRIRFSDLDSYRQRTLREHEEAMTELAEQTQALGMGY